MKILMSEIQEIRIVETGVSKYRLSGNAINLNTKKAMRILLRIESDYRHPFIGFCSKN